MKYSNYDDYIGCQREFARPILDFLRECIREGCPEAKEEFKWSFPNFTYKGSILAHMAAFKQHATFGFWLGAQMNDPDQVFQMEVKSGMGQFGKITSLEGLPSKEILVKYVKHATELTDQGKKLIVNKTSAKKQHAMPVEFTQALIENTLAKSGFENLSPSQRTEYIEWISEAKANGTKQRRLIQAIQWLSEGKPRNWKYMKKW